MSTVLRLSKCSQCGRPRQWRDRSPCWCGAVPGAKGATVAAVGGPVPLNAAAAPLDLLPCGLPEVDRMLGGGLLAPGSALLWGPPGSGKTRQALRIACGLGRTLIVGLEMRREMYLAAADSLGLPLELLAYVPELGGWASQAQAWGASCVVVDSLGVVGSPLDELRRICRHEWTGQPGHVALVIAHQNARGKAAGGPRLEHTTDTTIAVSASGVLWSRLRVLKHRGAVPGPSCRLPKGGPWPTPDAPAPRPEAPGAAHSDAGPLARRQSKSAET